MKVSFAGYAGDGVLNDAGIAGGNGFPVEVFNSIAPGVLAERFSLFCVGHEAFDFFLSSPTGLPVWQECRSCRPRKRL